MPLSDLEWNGAGQIEELNCLEWNGADQIEELDCHLKPNVDE